MRKCFFVIVYLLLAISSYSQNSIKFEQILDSIDWDYTTESDIIFMFKDNIVQGEKEESFGKYVGKYVIKNVVIDKYKISVAHIQVNKYNRKIMRISFIIDENEEDWKDPMLIVSNLETYLKSLFGHQYKKIFEYNYTYDNIECSWETNYDYGCAANMLLTPKMKLGAVSIGTDL